MKYDAIAFDLKHGSFKLILYIKTGRKWSPSFISSKHFSIISGCLKFSVNEIDLHSEACKNLQTHSVNIQAFQIKAVPRLVLLLWRAVWEVTLHPGRDN